MAALLARGLIRRSGVFVAAARRMASMTEPAAASCAAEERIAQLEQEIRLRRLEQELKALNHGMARRTLKAVGDNLSLRTFLVVFCAFVAVFPKAVESTVKKVVTELADVVTGITQEVFNQVEKSLDQWRVEQAQRAGLVRPGAAPGSDCGGLLGVPKASPIHGQQVAELKAALFADTTTSLFLVTGLRGSGKSWTLTRLVNEHADATVIKVNLVGVCTVDDLVNALAGALNVPPPTDDSTFRLFKSRLVGENHSTDSDMKNLRSMLHLLEMLAQRARATAAVANTGTTTLSSWRRRNARPTGPIILIVDDISAISFSEDDRRFTDAINTLIQQFEDWARTSLIRTVLVSSDHTIVDRVPRLHPSNPVIKLFQFNDLTGAEARQFLLERLAADAPVYPNRDAVVDRVVWMVGTNLLHLRHVVQELNQLATPTPAALDTILTSQVDKTVAYVTNILETLTDAAGQPLKQADLVRLVQFLHGTFCAPAADHHTDWRVHCDISSHPDYDFLRPLIPQLVAKDILVYYRAGTSKEISLNSKLEWSAVCRIHQQFAGIHTTPKHETQREPERVPEVQ